MVIFVKFYPNGHHDGTDFVLFIIVSLPSEQGLACDMYSVGIYWIYEQKIYASFFFLEAETAGKQLYIQWTINVVRSEERLGWARVLT